MKKQCLIFLFISMLGTCSQVQAQSFPKNQKSPWVWVELGTGFNQYNGNAKLFLSTLQVVPQYTLIEGRMRGGVVAGTFYQGTRFGLHGGPRITLKLLEGKEILTAASFNIQVFGELLFATRTQAEKDRQWLGGGLGFELDDLVVLSIKVHRDLQQPITYAQFGLAYHLTRPVPPVHPEFE